MITLRNLIDQLQHTAQRAPHVLDKPTNAESVSISDVGVRVLVKEQSNSISQQDTEEVCQTDDGILAEDGY